MKETSILRGKRKVISSHTSLDTFSLCLFLLPLIFFYFLFFFPHLTFTLFLPLLFSRHLVSSSSHSRLISFFSLSILYHISSLPLLSLFIIIPSPLFLPIHIAPLSFSLQHGSNLIGMTDLNVPEQLYQYMVGGHRRAQAGANRERHKSPSYQIKVHVCLLHLFWSQGT